MRKSCTLTIGGLLCLLACSPPFTCDAPDGGQAPAAPDDGGGLVSCDRDAGPAPDGGGCRPSACYCQPSGCFCSRGGGR